MADLRKDADFIIASAIQAVMPDEAVRRALSGKNFGSGKVVLVSVGKAGWQMAKSASDLLGERINSGVVITKYEHLKGPVSDFELFEAGHPVPDDNSFRATQAAIDLVSGLNEQDTVIFLLSGGGSTLFEKPLLPAAQLQRLTDELLASGADIGEINTIRKRVSAVKGGRFARICAPAQIYAVILSDVLGDQTDLIASGPVSPDSSTCEDAMRIAAQYHLTMSEELQKLLATETPDRLEHVETVVTGSVKELVQAAAAAAEKRGYQPFILTDHLNCEAREAGSMLASIARTYQTSKQSMAVIAGGETVVHLKGSGRGGRNQEIALAAAVGIAGLKDTAVFSVGSDGTDGPTDAAGGYADWETIGTKLSIPEARMELDRNNAYAALERTGGLIMTGATGTNVNDVSVLLIRR